MEGISFEKTVSLQHDSQRAYISACGMGSVHRRPCPLRLPTHRRKRAGGMGLQRRRRSVVGPAGRRRTDTDACGQLPATAVIRSGRHVQRARRRRATQAAQHRLPATSRKPEKFCTRRALLCRCSFGAGRGARPHPAHRPPGKQHRLHHPISAI